MNVITEPAWESTYYQTNTGGRELVNDPDGHDEIARVETALGALQARGMIAETSYDQAAFDRLRAAVRQHFSIHWTSITPVMERLLYALAATARPRTVVCTGAFCGNTVIWNVGPFTGPGQARQADHLVACEVVAEHVDLARANFAAIGAACDIRCEDGHLTVASQPAPIDLLYLDATGPKDHPDPQQRGKRIYRSLLETAYPYLADGALIVAHDTVPDWFTKSAGEYFELCRDGGRFRDSVEVRIDEMGLEVTRK